MDTFTVLNYQGSKKNLIDFIQTNTAHYIDCEKPILDIFAGSCSVGYSYKRTNTVYANDSEYYSYLISKALLSQINSSDKLNEICSDIKSEFDLNYFSLSENLSHYIILEEQYILNCQSEDLLILYSEYPTIWNGKITEAPLMTLYNLFSTYYAGTYFGIVQSMEIDSLRYAFEKFKDTKLFAVLISSLFFAMKECVFSKDGHMAQPLDPKKNMHKLNKKRGKSIYDNFIMKLSCFFGESFVQPFGQNKSFNYDFKDLLKNKEIQEDVGFIYADPPYTDMQYSRYYHLLNIVAKYDYPKPTISSQGYTKGLYTENRFQSDLSKKNSCFNAFEDLILFSKSFNKNLAISFAYPVDVISQKTDRYVMSVEQIKQSCLEIYGAINVEAVSIDYCHSNNRNSEGKKVLEYLILCKNK